MAEGDSSRARHLDPVVIEALQSITQRVYHRRGPRLEDRFRRYYSMLDRESRDCAIAAFKHLQHAGYEFPSFLVRRWAMANSWKERDAQLLDDYAAGVLGGVKFHHSDPFGRHTINEWQRDAGGKQPWVDPGRPPHGTPLTRRD
jgi:hypothetical protein